MGNVDCERGCKSQRKNDAETKPSFDLDIFERQSSLPQNNSRLYNLAEDENEEYDLHGVYPELVADLWLKLK